MRTLREMAETLALVVFGYACAVFAFALPGLLALAWQWLVH